MPQCDNCYKFYPDARAVTRHRQSCEQARNRRYEFVRSVGELYFCYKGCSNALDRDHLMQHLLRHHHDRLDAWGFNPWYLHLELWAKAFGSYGGVVLPKREDIDPRRKCNAEHALTLLELEAS